MDAILSILVCGNLLWQQEKANTMVQVFRGENKRNYSPEDTVLSNWKLKLPSGHVGIFIPGKQQAKTHGTILARMTDRSSAIVGLEKHNTQININNSHKKIQHSHKITTRRKTQKQTFGRKKKMSIIFHGYEEDKY